MACDGNNFGARLASQLEFLHRRFAHTMLCQPFTFNFGLISDIFQEGINVVDPHSLSFTPHLKLRALKIQF